MKNQNSFSSHNTNSRQVKLFNPNSSKVDEDLSHLKIILTKHLMPATFNRQVTDAFSQLYSKIPRYESSSNLSEVNRVGDFDPFWKQWIIFRDDISKLTDQTIIFFIQQFMNERFDEFNEILEDLNTKPPQKVPQYREYDKSKKEIQTSFENLQQILLEQFDVDSEEDEDDSRKNKNKKIETIIKNLQSQRSKIRQIKTDVDNKHRPFFVNSSQDKDLSEKQHQRCVKIIDEILIKINGLPKQYHQFNSISSELYKAEEKIKAKFAPNKVDVPPFDSKKEEKKIDQFDHNGQIDENEEEEIFEEEEEEVFLEEDIFEEEEEEEADFVEEQVQSTLRKTNSEQEINQSKSQFQSPIKQPNSTTKKVPLTPPPSTRNPFQQINRNQQQDDFQQRKQINQKMSLTPQKKPPRLQITAAINGSIDDPENNDRNSQKNNVRQLPQSAKPVQKLPHIKPLDLEDDALVDTFHGLSFSFSSSSSSSSDGESSSKKRRSNNSNSTNKNNRSYASQRKVDNDTRPSYKSKKQNVQTDPSIQSGGPKSGSSWRNGKTENDQQPIKSSYKIENINIKNKVDDDDDVWSYQSSKTTPPSSPRGPQPNHFQGPSARMRSKSPSSSILHRRIINSRNASSTSSSDEKNERTRPIGRPNSSMMNQPASPAKKHSTLNPDTERFHSVDGIIETETDTDIITNKNQEFNTQPSVPISPVRSQQQQPNKHNLHTPVNNTATATASTPLHVPKMQKQTPVPTTNNANSKQSEGMRQQLLTVTKEKENLQIQLANTKSEIEQLKDDYQTIVVQLQIAYEENKESIEETSKLNATIEKMTKEKETMSAKIKDLQLLLLQTPVFDSSDKLNKRDLPEKLKKLGSSDSNSDDDTNNESQSQKSTNAKSSSTATKGKKGKKKTTKKDSEKDDSDDGDLNKTVQMYQTKLKNLMYEKEALYDNINKLADDNAHLKEQLTTITSQPSLPPIDQPFYIDQLKLLEEDQEYFTEELQRVWKSYDSLLARLNSKSKDDSVYFENSKLHKENDKLHSKLIASRKEIQFLKDIRKSSVMSKNSKNGKNSNLNENDIEKIELRKKLEDEKRKNEALIKALREEKQKTAANIVSEDEHRQLFNAKLTIHKLQYELQKVSSKFVHVKGKNKRLKLMMNEKGIQIVKDEMSNEIDAMRDAYESAIDWGYAQQEISIKEQSEKEALAFKVKLLEENLRKVTQNNGQEAFDSQTEEVLAEMKVKIEEKLKLQHELDVIRELVVEKLNGSDENEVSSNVSTADLVEKALQTNRNENS